MINLMIKSIFENSNKIDAVIKYINKTEIKRYLGTVFVTLSICSLTKKVKEQEAKINSLEEMMLKGE